MSKIKFEEKRDIAKEIVKLAAQLGYPFGVNIDECGGYVEVDNLTFNFNENMDLTSSDISL